MTTYFIIAAVSYLLGSIPFGYILVKLFLKQDIRATGSGNIGATNVARSGARGLAIATLVLDAAKGFISVGIVLGTIETYSQDWTFAALAALCSIVGHMFPVWLRFKGGKGVATGVGGFLGLAPASIGISLILFVAVVAVSRYV